MRFIGDIHGKFGEYKRIASVAEQSIQVGDFGIGFHPPMWHDEVNVWHNVNDYRHRFIRGNHDSPGLCREEMQGFIADGTIENDVMFVGGAASIDVNIRTEGVNWWRDEEASYDELGFIVEQYDLVRPRVMVTHDAPDTVARHFFKFYRENNRSRTRSAFDHMFEMHKPDLWIFGHWHESRRKNIMGTEFICLDKLEYVDIDL